MYSNRTLIFKAYPISKIKTWTKALIEEFEYDPVLHSIWLLIIVVISHCAPAIETLTWDLSVLKLVKKLKKISSKTLNYGLHTENWFH